MRSYSGIDGEDNPVAQKNPIKAAIQTIHHKASKYKKTKVKLSLVMHHSQNVLTSLETRFVQNSTPNISTVYANFERVNRGFEVIIFDGSVTFHSTE